MLKTIFGPVRITRMSDSHTGAASIHALDEFLQLPARSFSYELQKRMVKAAVQGTFRETRERLAEITGAPIHTRSIEEVIQDAAEEFDVFYAQRDPPPWAETGSVLVAAVDGKGIPMIKPEGAHPLMRLTKGQKTNLIVRRWPRWPPCYTRAPWVRTPQQVVIPPRSAGPQILRGAHRQRASFTDSGQPTARSRFDSRFAAYTGEVVGGRLCLPCRRQSGGRAVGPPSGPENS